MKQQIECQIPSVMAIVNVTPDSFYASSRSMLDRQIVSTIESAVENGASIIDFGGYSTRPGATDVTPDEEFDRLDRAMRIVKEIAPNMPISIDTFRSDVVERLYDNWGAFTVNDVSAGEAGTRMVETVGRLSLPYIAMHSRGVPATMQSMTDYDDVCEEVRAFFVRKIEQCHAEGIRDLTIDPGFGFAKTTAQNFELLRGLHRLCELGMPVLVGLSRKTMIWKTLGVTPDEALAGTVALNWEALRQGVSIIRVHDVREAVMTVKLYREFRD